MNHDDKVIVENVEELIEIADKVIKKEPLLKRIKKLLFCGCKGCVATSISLSLELAPFLM